MNRKNKIGGYIGGRQKRGKWLKKGAWCLIFMIDVGVDPVAA